MGPPEANGAVRPARRSKADLVDAALGILDEQGLPDLTMRRIAEALGVQPSALYWHFPNKQTLLAAVSDRILEPSALAPDPAAPWSDAAVSVASRLRQCLLQHRDGAELVSSSLAMGLITPAAQRLIFDLAVTALIAEPLARVAASTITHFVLGYTFHEQQRHEAANNAALAAGVAPGGPVDPSNPVHAADPERVAADELSNSEFVTGVSLIVLGTTAFAAAGGQTKRNDANS